MQKGKGQPGPNPAMEREGLGLAWPPAGGGRGAWPSFHPLHGAWTFGSTDDHCSPSYYPTCGEPHGSDAVTAWVIFGLRAEVEQPCLIPKAYGGNTAD